MAMSNAPLAAVRVSTGGQMCPHGWPSKVPTRGAPWASKPRACSASGTLSPSSTLRMPSRPRPQKGPSPYRFTNCWSRRSWWARAGCTCGSPRSQRAQVFGVTPSSWAASACVRAPSARRRSTRSSSERLAEAVLYVTSRSTRARLFHPPCITRGDDHHRVLQEAIEERNRGRLDRQEVAPLLERPVAGHAQAAALVRGGHEPEQQRGTRVVERSEAELVEQHQFVPQELADHFAHGGVRQAALNASRLIRQHGKAA